MKKKLYLANDYGFSKSTIDSLDKFLKLFNELNLETYEPFEKSKKYIANETNWAYKVAKANFNAIKESDCLFAIVNGSPPDEGIMVEIGIAIALKKEVFLFRDDFRFCTDSDQYPLNLMIFLGLPENNW